MNESSGFRMRDRKEPSLAGKIVGAVTAGLTIALFGSLVVWAIVAIWRAIL